MDCSDVVVIAASGGAAISSDVTPVTLEPYTEYLGCAAFSVFNTSSVKYEAPRPIPLFLALDHSSSYNADLADLPNSAKFNDGCTANVTPWTCCTGDNTGTCDGLPASIQLLTPQFTHGPMLKLGR
jgi:hypothetical protein